METVTMVKKIKVEGVINRYDYNIDFTEGNEKIKAVYAENGHGKTNMLKILRFLTSKNLDDFKKMFSLPFRRLTIESNKGTLMCFKVKSKLYSMYIVKIDNEVEDFSGIAESAYKTTNSELESKSSSLLYDISLDEITQDTEGGDGEVDEEKSFREKYEDISEAVEYIVGDVVFLGASRLQDFQIILDILPDAHFYTRMIRQNLGDVENYPYGRDISGDVVDLMLNGLAVALGFESRKISLGKNRRRHMIYYDIIKKIIDNKGLIEAPGSCSAQEIITEKSRAVWDGIDGFDSYGLLNSKEFKLISSVINDISEDKVFDDLYGVLVPYLDNLLNQIDELSSIAYLIDAFIDAVNTLFGGIQVKFNDKNLGKFKIYSKYEADGSKCSSYDGPPLKGSDLSSGEKHLLVMLSVLMICSLKSTSLILIDEPEISLGILWQKSLTKYFKKIIKNQNTQLVFATHSPIILDDFEDIDIAFSKTSIVKQEI